MSSSTEYLVVWNERNEENNGTPDLPEEAEKREPNDDLLNSKLALVVGSIEFLLSFFLSSKVYTCRVVADVADVVLVSNREINEETMFALHRDIHFEEIGTNSALLEDKSLVDIKTKRPKLKPKKKSS